MFHKDKHIFVGLLSNEGCTYLLVSDDQYPDNLRVDVSHESLQWRSVLKNKEANRLCVSLHV